MKKNYNIASKSDMRRFTKDLEKALHHEVNKAIMQGTYPLICPKCNVEFQATVGNNICPCCHENINLEIDT